MSRQNSHIFSSKNPLQYRLSLIWTTDTKSWPQRVNLYQLNLFYYGHCVNQVNPESQSGESAQGESHLVWLMSYAKWCKAQLLYMKQRFAKGVQRNTTDFLKASITTDSITIFSTTVILHSSYCLLHWQNSKRHFQNCVLQLFTCSIALCFVSF